MTTCLLYARVSSKEQEKEGFSIPAQLDLLRDYATRHHLTVAQEYTEAETAKQSGREQFAKLLAYLAQPNAPTILLVEKTDRLYRNFRDYVALETLINERGLEIHLVKEGEILSKNASSHIKFIHGIKVLMAKNYIDNLSEEVRKGHLKKVQQGGWITLAPYGYRMADRQLEINPDTRPMVERAFAIYATGQYSLKATASKLADEGYSYKAKGRRISVSELDRILKNPVYIGKVAFKGDVYQGTHEAIIPDALWYQVQSVGSIKSKPTREDSKDFIYKGVLICGECGGKLTGEYKKGGKYTYYRCARFKDGCSQGYISEALLDAEVSRVIKQLQLPEDLKGRLRKAAKAMTDAQQRTASQEVGGLNAKITKAKDAISQAYQDRLDGIISPEMFQTVRQAKDATIAKAKARLEAVDVADHNYYDLMETFIELGETLASQWLVANFARKKALMGIITSNFIVTGQNASLEIIEPFSALLPKAKNVKWGPWCDELRNVLPLVTKLKEAMSA